MSTTRPPKAPPLTSMPSTPGPQVPGGYPRNSVVFSTNEWDRAPPQITQSSNTTTSLSDYLSPAAHAHLAGHTPGVALHTDGSTSAASDFSTRTYAGSGGTLTPTQGHGDLPSPGLSSGSNPRASEFESGAGSTSNTSGVDSTANSDLDQRRTSTATAMAAATTVDSATDARRVDPLPSVAPISSMLTSTVSRPAPAAVPQPNSTTTPTSPASPPSSGSGSGSGFSSNASASTAPSSPASPAPHTKFVLSPMPSSPASHEKGFSASMKRFASLRRRGEKGKAAPPSAFGGAGHVRGGSLDTATASGADSPDDANPHVHFDTATDPRQKPSRRASLLRTLRGEASVLAGRVRGDRERVERGRRMISGEVLVSLKYLGEVAGLSSNGLFK
ncbi:hypothetical protein B0H13DRAFT_2374010 [Mycena leptocephala]|nr:hypothetical protein B0H13DRAFT_2374010 [Mycena leptocephala]